MIAAAAVAVALGCIAIVSEDIHFVLLTLTLPWVLVCALLWMAGGLCSETVSNHARLTEEVSFVEEGS